MAWVRLDDQFADHPKVAGLSNDAFCLHVTAMCWTAKQQTDGKLPSRLLSRLAWRCQDPATAAAELVNAGVWDIDPVDGWEIHDYGEYNPTKAQSDELAGKRSEAGKAGAMARWQNHSKPDGKSHGKPDGKHNGKTMPPSPSPDDDIAAQRRKAIEAIQQFGLFNASMLAQFDDMWPELVQERRLCWIDDAVRVARAKNASTPQYALKVLANAIHTGKAPGYVNGESHDADNRPRVPAPSREEQAAADARQAEYERQIAEQLARAGKL